MASHKAPPSSGTGAPGGGGPDMNAIADAVLQRLGVSDPQIANLVREELQAATGTPLAASEKAAAPRTTKNEPLARSSRLVVTATGRNRSGIVVRLASAIDEFEGDIRDISQTIVGDYFTILFVVDIAGTDHSGGTTRLMQLRERLNQVGEELSMHVVAMHDDILSVMHEI